ncbi:hypothetical protein VNO78_15894 [Psophocarpus tetragonolobus]|uniref:Uncharacterized protein n=1 Tax=Psophocarpus tetragonolobus TaxID=3891 RepID=A0AAN9SL94_PSOTE
MSGSTIKIFSIIIFLVLISKSYSQCFVSDIVISQSPTGVKVQGKPEWSVSITNKCHCIQGDVILACKGFQSLEPVNPSILKVSPNGCLLNSGKPIQKNGVNFKYVSDQQYPFKPISSGYLCTSL